MKDNEFDVDQYQDELNDAVNDGGGCIEIAEQAAEQRELIKSRRGFVASFALLSTSMMSGTAAGSDERKNQNITSSESSFGGLPDGVDPDDVELDGIIPDELDLDDINPDTVDLSDVETESLEGKERGQVLSEALKTNQTKRIRKKLIQDGFTPQKNEAKVTRVTVDGEENDSVVIPFKSTGKNSSDEPTTALIWSNKDNIDTVGIQALSEGDQFVYTTYSVSGQEVITERAEMPNFLGCSNVNFRCVFQIAARYSLIIPACGPCASGLIPWCAACIGAAIIAIDYAADGCEWCRS